MLEFLDDSAPVWTDILAPAVGVEATDERRPSLAMTVGHAVVVNAALASFGTRERCSGEPHLRSQNVAIAGLAMPAQIIGSPEKGVKLCEWVRFIIHKLNQKEWFFEAAAPILVIPNNLINNLNEIIWDDMGFAGGAASASELSALPTQKLVDRATSFPTPARIMSQWNRNSDSPVTQGYG